MIIFAYQNVYITKIRGVPVIQKYNDKSSGVEAKMENTTWLFQNYKY